MSKLEDGRPDPRRLDLNRLADDGQALAGAWPLQGFPRLIDGAEPAGDALVHWSTRAERRAVPGAGAQPWLHLKAQALLRLTCQRCLQSVEEALTVERSFRFVADEAAAEREDEEAEEEVLALPPRGRLDLQPLLEDELILALPLVPRHTECPQPLPLPADDGPADEGATHPFAALAALKRGQGEPGGQGGPA